MAEPIDDLNKPKVKQVRRLSCYFIGGGAQDFTLEKADVLDKGTPGQWVIRHAAGGPCETIYVDKLCWFRDQMVTVRIINRKAVTSDEGREAGIAAAAMVESGR